jgi:glycerol kinase
VASILPTDRHLLKSTDDIIIHHSSTMAACTDLICAIDQGTSSTRVIVFRTSDWEVVCQHQVEFASLYPEEGWCEQDPLLILQTVKEVYK